MHGMSDPALPRWAAMTASRLAGAFGAILGVVLLARAVDWPTKALGVAIVIAAMWMMAVVPRALARRWRTPE
jgi:membrane protein YdbS with pleckstrin-like domain